MVWVEKAASKASKRQQTSTTVMDVRSEQSLLQRTVFFPSGDKYTGQWLDNKKHGRGTQIWSKSGAVYSGEWKQGKPDGYGTYSVLLPETKVYAKKYCGEWKSGRKHGNGTYVYSESAVYEGVWIEDRRAGRGKMNYENGDVYEGEWMKDKCHGHGIIRYANGNWYEGGWREGKRNGRGKVYFPDKGQLYEGFWVDGDAKCGTLSDFGRDEAATLTKFPIPQLQLVDTQSVLKEALSAVMVGVEEQGEELQHFPSS